MKKRMMSALLFIATPMVVSAQTRDLTIGDMFQLIEQNSKSLRQQKTSAAVAEEGVKSAKSQQLPDIDAQLSASYIGNAVLTDRDFTNVHGLKTPHFGNTFNLDVQQTIYAGGAISAGIKMAELGVEQANLGTEQHRQDQRFLALGEYLSLQKLSNRAKVIQSNIELTQKLIDNINDKQQQGMALKNDVTRYELQMQTLRLNLVKLKNQCAILNHQLCNTLGLSSDTEINPVEQTTQTAYDKKEENSWQGDAVATSQKMRMASIDEQMALQQEKIVKSDMLPKVAFVANNNFNGPITFELPPIDKNLNVWYVGVGVQYSLSSLFKSNSKLRQARLSTRRAQETTAVVREQLNNQVQSAYTEYMQSYIELETQEKEVELSNENYQVVNDRYLNQLALITDMIDASNMKLDAELSEVDARINIAYAYYKMKYIVGNL